jgi:hypothetical protein
VISSSRLRYAAGLLVLGVLCGIGVLQLSGTATASAAPNVLAAASSSKTLLNCVQVQEINQAVCLATKLGPRGPRGLRGATGAKGATGAAGPTGAVGAAGQTGSTGANGPAGPAGPTGSTGATGAPGATGATGATAWSAVTPYDGTQTYTAGPPASIVTYQAGTYVYIGSAPSSAAPSDTSDWEEIAAPGQTGPQGVQGDPGPQGIQGIQGVQGAQGLAGCASGGSSSCTIVQEGNKIGPIVASGVSLSGSETYSVAECPTSDPEAYGGGGLIIKQGNNSGGDIVTLAASYPGTYAGSGAQVTPETTNTVANAYEAEAIVTELSSGDNYTLQAYAVCGP